MNEQYAQQQAQLAAMNGLPSEQSMSDSIAELAKALAAAQGSMDHAKKDASNPFFKSKYADLAACIDASRESLSKNGLCVMQLTEPHGDKGVCIVTLLAHASGQWVRSRLYLPTKEQTAQGMGSAITYARRYAYSALVCLAADDDDGNLATRPQAPNVRKVEPRVVPDSTPDGDDGAAKGDSVSIDWEAQLIKWELELSTIISKDQWLHKMDTIGSIIMQQHAPAAIRTRMREVSEKARARIGAA